MFKLRLRKSDKPVMIQMSRARRQCIHNLQNDPDGIDIYRNASGTTLKMMLELEKLGYVRRKEDHWVLTDAGWAINKEFSDYSDRVGMYLTL